MSLKSQIETAKDAVSKALITALQDKNETAISDLFDAYNKLVSIHITETNKNMFTIGNSTASSAYYGSVGSYGAVGSDDVISFPNR